MTLPRCQAWTALLLAPALVAVLAARSAAQPAFEEVLPESTVIAMLVDDLAGSRADVSDSSWGRVWADPAFAEARAVFESSIDAWAATSKEAWGSDPLELLDMLQGQAALALLQLAPPVGEDEPPTVVLALLLGLGEHAEAFADGFDTIIDRWVKQAGLVLKTGVVRELPMATVLDPDGKKGELRYTFAENTLVAVIASRGSEQGDQLGLLVDALHGEGEHVLADSPAYRASSAAPLPDDLHGMRFWCDFAAPWKLLRDFAEEAGTGSETWKVIDGLRLDALTSFSASSWFQEGWGRSISQLAVTEAEGLFGVLSAAIQDQRPQLLALVPPGVHTAVALDLDLAAAFDASLELATRIDPKLGWSLISGMSDAEAELGFHPKDDLVDRLDGQLAFFMGTVPPEEALPGTDAADPRGFCLLVGLQDGEEVRRLIDDQVRRNGLHAARSRQEFEGFDLYLIPIMPVTVVYAVLDDLFILSLSPSLVQDVLRRRANPELASLATDESFQAARALLPEDATVVSYARAGDGLRSVLAMLNAVQSSGSLALNPMAPPTELPPELAEWLARFPLPGPEVVDRHIEGAELGVVTLGADGSLRMSQAVP